MHVRSFEIVNADLRKLHDHLLEVGGFQFRAGGSGFFVLIGEKFYASESARQANLILAQLEADTVSIDVVAAGGSGNAIAGDERSQKDFLARAHGLLAGFAQRHDLEISDL